MIPCSFAIGHFNALNALSKAQVIGIRASDVFALSGDYIYGDMEDILLVKDNWRVVLMRMCGKWLGDFWLCESEFRLVRGSPCVPVSEIEFICFFRNELKRLLTELSEISRCTIQSLDDPSLKSAPLYYKVKELNIGQILEFCTSLSGEVDLCGFTDLVSLGYYYLLNADKSTKFTMRVCGTNGKKAKSPVIKRVLKSSTNTKFGIALNELSKQLENQLNDANSHIAALQVELASERVLSNKKDQSFKHIVKKIVSKGLSFHYESEAKSLKIVQLETNLTSLQLELDKQRSQFMELQRAFYSQGVRLFDLARTVDRQ